MVQSVEEIVRKFKATSRKLRREHNTPAKARALLLEMGILEKSPKSPKGVRLAKRFR